MRKLEGKVAVVTGAGHGIGRETALALAHKGCRLAVCDVNEEALEAARAELEATGATVTAHRVDVSDQAQMEQFASDVAEAHGDPLADALAEAPNLSRERLDKRIQDFRDLTCF